ncbi:MAG: hypothetical protein KDC52_15675 [Ignavibacteriae bacterium]|nr:hypothetical protein [Gelidibacter sp.]MCB0752911.1 hypothetical protein [Ignavibacteriota bacterium]
MTEIIGKLKTAMELTPEHLLEARGMAQAIFKLEPDKHPEMLAEIKKTLLKLHEQSAKNISNV